MYNNAFRFLVIILFALLWISGCSGDNAQVIDTPTPIPSIDPTTTFIPTLTTTPTHTLTTPQNLVFYGDSSLAIGDAGDGLDHVGFSFVTNLRDTMDPIYNLITANFGGRTAKWAFEHLEENVLVLKPNVVTLWWGFDDLGGCPGIFNRETNRLDEFRLNLVITYHVDFMKLIIDRLLEDGTSIIILTPIPVLDGQLPWSHLDEDYKIFWEEGRWCNFNAGLEKLAYAHRSLVSDYEAKFLPVYLVDVWQLYIDNLGLEKMYMDVVHPASTGVRLIADEWLKVFEILSKE